MKKIFYYIAVSICWLIFLMYMFGPFGGPMSLFDYIKNGQYSERYIQNDLLINYTEPVKLANQLIGVLFNLSILICMSLVFFRKLSIQHKFTIAFICIIILLLIIFVHRIYGTFFI